MNKRIAIFAIVAAAFTASAPAWAFKSVARSTVTAQVTTGGAKIANVSVKIRNTSAPFGADQAAINWTGVSVPYAPGWKVADQFLLLVATVTDVNGGVQIYTRNMDNDALPKFVDPTPGDTSNADSNPAGLLMGTVGTTSSVLPMAWSIKTASATIGADLVAADPNSGPETGAGNRYQWLFMSDKNTPAIPSTNTTAFSNGAEFVTAINGTGVHSAQGPAGFFAHPNGANSFVYLQASFSQAAAQQSYRTTTLTVESFIE